MNVSTFNSWETTHTTTDDNTFYSDDEPRKIFFANNSHPAAAAKAEKEIEPGNVLSKSGGSVAAHLRSLRSDDPLNKEHPGSIEKEVEL